MALNFPLLRGHDTPFLPRQGGGCCLCGKTFEGGFAYLGAGAVVHVDPDYEDDPFCRALRDPETAEPENSENGSPSAQIETSDFDPPLEAFFYVGYHGADADMSDSGGVAIVEKLSGGQFDLQFCSTSCLRQFFWTVVDEVEKRLARREETKGTTFPFGGQHS